MLKIFVIILFVAVLGFLFIKLYKPFGSSPNKKDMKDYSKRSKIFKDGRFINDRDINARVNIMFEGLKYCFN